MQRSLIISLALMINLIIFGFYAYQGIRDYIVYYEAYKNLNFFKHLFWTCILPLIATLSFAGLFKIRWAAILSLLAGLIFYLFMTYGFIEWHFDPMEQG